MVAAKNKNLYALNKLKGLGTNSFYSKILSEALFSYSKSSYFDGDFVKTILLMKADPDYKSKDGKKKF